MRNNFRDARAAFEAGKEIGLDKGEARGMEEGCSRFAFALIIASGIVLAAILAALVYGNTQLRAKDFCAHRTDAIDRFHTGGFLSK